MQKIIRQNAITKAITDGNIHNQNELQEILKASRINVTQSTLSRDLKEMKIMRLPNADGEYVYALPLEASMAGLSDDSIQSNASGKEAASSYGNPEFSGRHRIKVRSIEFSSLFAVIKTAPGFASAVAAVIDDNNIKGIMGTIAGDDTILVMIKDGFTQSQIVPSLSNYISGLQ